MTKIQDLFFELLRCELWQQPINIDFNDEQLFQLIELGKWQKVQGLIIAALIRNTGQSNQEILMPSYLLLQKTKNLNLYINQMLASFTRHLHEHGMKFCVVKGGLVAQCYPHPDYRVTGDIDYYCPPKHYQSVKDLLSQRVEMTIENHHSTKHDTFEFKNVHFEQHSILTDFVTKAHRKCWDEAVAEDMKNIFHVRIDDTDIPSLSPTLHAAYIFIHFFFHLMTTGIQLRQLCDWMMWMSHYEKEIDRERLARLLKGTGMYKAFCTLGGILVEYLGMPESTFPLPLLPDARKKVKRYVHNILKMREYGYGLPQITQAGILHSLQTALISTRQSFIYFPLAPAEVGLRVPDMLVWFFKSRLNKGQHRRQQMIDDDKTTA